MSWTNYHGHCHYCDGKGAPEEYVITAIEAKMSAIGFTSHAPVPFDSFWNMPSNRLMSYLNEIDILKAKYQSQISIFKSLEVDYISELMGPKTDFTQSLKLDYVIGSVHFLGQTNDGVHWAIDGSFDSFKAGLTDIFNGDIKQAVKTYYHQQCEMMERQTPDIIGHLDKIKMHNMHELLFDESSSWYRDEVRQLLELIAKKNCIVEINTKSFARNNLLFPGEEHFQWLYELKIPVVINSDAHYPEHLIAGFKDVAEMLNQNGITEVAILHDEKWIMKSFDKNGIKF